MILYASDFVSLAGTKMSKARDYIDDLASKGVHHFTSEAMCRALSLSPDAAKMALLRLGKQGLTASPARGFYVILPPEYKRLGCLPADQFIPSLMQERGLAYYAGLLSAAQYHGAAHHRPQEFQIAVAKNRRAIECGMVRVAFFARSRLAKVATQKFNTPRGTILVSTVEATVIDLAGYASRVGGLDQTATILAELAEQIDPQRLVLAAQTAPIAWAQRAGYILELVGAQDKAAALKEYVRQAARDKALLLPSAPAAPETKPNAWRLNINTDIEVET